MESHKPIENVLVFWNINGNTRVLEKILEIKSDYKVCLGNLFLPALKEYQSLNKRKDSYTWENTIESLTAIEQAGCRLLKGETERSLKQLPDEEIAKKIKNLPIRLGLRYSEKFGEVVFLPTLPLGLSDQENKDIRTLEAEIINKSSRQKKTLVDFNSADLTECYGSYIGINLRHLQEYSPLAETFLIGREECALWQRSVKNRAVAVSAIDTIFNNQICAWSMKSMTTGNLISTGSAKDGYCCYLDLKKKDLFFYKVR